MHLQYLASNFPSVTKHDILISSEYFNKQTSYVYVKDVAIAILKILKSDIKNEIFNISFQEPISINQFYNLLASFIKPNLELNLIETDSDIDHGFPSVKRSLCINKAKNLLNFAPTNIEEAFEETVQFYTEASSKYPSECKSIMKNLIKELELDENLLKKMFNLK